MKKYSFLFLILFFACSDTQTTIDEQSNSSSTSVIENLDKTTTTVPETTTSTISENIDEEFLSYFKENKINGYIKLSEEEIQKTYNSSYTFTRTNYKFFSRNNNVNK